MPVYTKGPIQEVRILDQKRKKYLRVKAHNQIFSFQLFPDEVYSYEQSSTAGPIMLKFIRERQSRGRENHEELTLLQASLTTSDSKDQKTITQSEVAEDVANRTRRMERTNKADPNATAPVMRVPSVVLNDSISQNILESYGTPSQSSPGSEASQPKELSQPTQPVDPTPPESTPPGEEVVASPEESVSSKHHLSGSNSSTARDASSSSSKSSGSSLPEGRGKKRSREDSKDAKDSASSNDVSSNKRARGDKSKSRQSSGGGYGSFYSLPEGRGAKPGRKDSNDAKDLASSTDAPSKKRSGTDKSKLSQSSGSGYGSFYASSKSSLGDRGTKRGRDDDSYKGFSTADASNKRSRVDKANSSSSSAESSRQAPGGIPVNKM